MGSRQVGAYGHTPLRSLTPLGPLTVASLPPLHGVERGQAERSEAGGEAS